MQPPDLAKDSKSEEKEPEALIDKDETSEKEIETKSNEPSAPIESPGKKSSVKKSGGGSKTRGESAKKQDKSEDIKKAAEEAKMTTRPRRDSTSSLAAAMQVKLVLNWP